MRTLRWLPLLAFFAAPVLAEDWPGWLGPRRDGTSKETVKVI